MDELDEQLNMYIQRNTNITNDQTDVKHTNERDLIQHKHIKNKYVKGSTSDKPKIDHQHSMETDRDLSPTQEPFDDHHPNSSQFSSDYDEASNVGSEDVAELESIFDTFENKEETKSKMDNIKNFFIEIDGNTLLLIFHVKK